MGAKQEADWMGGYYQYANRLAHLYFLYILCRVPTWMVFIYFLGAKRTYGVRTRQEWAEGLARIQTSLGLPQEHPLVQRIVNVFPRVDKLVKTHD